MAIAETLYEEYCAKMEALEEKKGAVTGKISSAIDSLEKKRKEHVDMAKEDPKNASQHKDKIAMLATKIDDLMSKLEKVERSKKAKEEKKDKETIKENEEPKGATSTSGLAKMFRQLAQNLPSTPGMSSKEIAGIEKLINTILSKASAGEIALAIGKAQLALDNSTKNVGGKPAMPVVPAKKSSDNKYAAPAMPALPKKGNFSLNNDR
jgi:chromosome segregation ATPase